MSISSVIDNLNNLSQLFVTPTYNVKFYNGQSIIKTSEIAKQVIPYGKVAVVYFKSQYANLGKDFATMLKGNGNSVTHIVLPDDFEDSIEHFSHLFNLAEDIRLVVATDCRLFKVVKYFASVRAIESLLIVDNLSCYGLLNNYLVVSNGGNLQKVQVNVKTHVVIDYDKILLNNECLADTYAFLVSHALALTDYRIFLNLNGIKPNKTAFSVAIKSVTDAYGLLKVDKNDRVKILLKDLISLELANAVTSDSLYSCFSCATASYLINGDLSEKGKNRLLCAIPLSKLYNLLLTGDYENILEYPDYLQLVDFVCENVNIERQKVVDVIKRQVSIINSSTKSIKKIKQKIITDVVSFIDCSKNMYNTFIALGGDAKIDKKLRDRAIKHSGDIMLNGVTLLRESGIIQHV